MANANYTINFVGKPDPERAMDALCRIFENRHKGYKFTWRERTPEEMMVGGANRNEQS